jgi:hypothetical protein
MKATLRVHPGESAGVTPESAEQVLQLAPGSITPVKVTLRSSSADKAVEWPTRWTVFTGVPSDIDLTRYASLPSAIEAAGKTYLPRIARARDQRIDLAALAGGYRERAEALCFAELESPEDQTIRVGAAADWWMAWYVNGKLVYSTIDSGNGGAQAISTHQFNVPVKKGRNLIAVRVQSGSMGFALITGGPEELKAMRSSGNGLAAGLMLDVEVDGTTISRQPVAVRRRHVLANQQSPLASPADLLANPPAGDFLEENLENEWARQPDSSRWWKGESDLAGSIWVYADRENLHVYALSRDDTHRDGDNLQLMLAGESGAVTKLDAHGSGAMITRFEEGKFAGRTMYHVAIPRNLIAGSRIAINARLVDDDWGVTKQTISWYPWQSAPETWYQAYMP